MKMAITVNFIILRVFRYSLDHCLCINSDNPTTYGSETFILEKKCW